MEIIDIVKENRRQLVAGVTGAKELDLVEMRDVQIKAVTTTKKEMQSKAVHRGQASNARRSLRAVTNWQRTDTPDDDTMPSSLKEIDDLLARCSSEDKDACSWSAADSTSTEGVVKNLSDALNRDASSAVLLNVLEQSSHWQSGKLLVEHLVYAIGLENDTRYWAVHSLWLLFQRYAAANKTALTTVGDGNFSSIVLSKLRDQDGDTGFHVAMDRSIYLALLELGLGKPSKPEKGVPGHVETFGQTLAQAEPYVVILQLLQDVVTSEIRRDALKDLNMLLLRKVENVDLVLHSGPWQSWFWPLFGEIPEDSSLRDELEEDINKYVVAAFSCLHSRAFMMGKAKKSLDQSLGSLHTYAGWSNDSVALARVLLGSLIVKVGMGARSWRFDWESSSWGSLWELIAVLEDFMFYRLAISIAELVEPDLQSKGQFVLSPHPAAGSWRPLTQGVDDAATTLGIHLNPLEGTCDDMALARCTVDLLSKLGIKAGGDSSDAMMTDRKQREIAKKGEEVANGFRDYITLFQSINDQGEDGDLESQYAVMEKVSAFLQRRNRRGVGMGFFSRSKKKQIVRLLGHSMVKQQAQRIIRSQSVTAFGAPQLITAAPVVEKVEDDSHANEVVVAQKQRMQMPTSNLPQGVGGAGEPGSQEMQKTMLHTSFINSAEDDAMFECHGCHEQLLGKESIAAMNCRWHPEHFVCVMCDEPFNKIKTYLGSSPGEFFVHPPAIEAESAEDQAQVVPRPYCKRDYLKLDKIAGKICAGCVLPFETGDVAFAALEMRFHLSCFKCANCNHKISAAGGEAYYQFDKQPYCSGCYGKLYNSCSGCGFELDDAEPGLSALGCVWHADGHDCFKCAAAGCGNVLVDVTYYGGCLTGDFVERPFCEEHYLDLFVPKCRGCDKPVQGGVHACGGVWHDDCLKCTEPGCECKFENGSFFEGTLPSSAGDAESDAAPLPMPYCEDHYFARFGERCAGCNEQIHEDVFHALDQAWHPEHFTCGECGE
jgi:paxillin